MQRLARTQDRRAGLPCSLAGTAERGKSYERVFEAGIRDPAGRRAASRTTGFAKAGCMAGC